MFGKKSYTTPIGGYYELYSDMLKQSHLLIAGQTGSGKSVVINGIITTALYNTPNDNQFIFIDPKRVELCKYKTLPHCLYYASEMQEMRIALQAAMRIIDSRYQEMQKKQIVKYAGSHVYIVIDELADLLTTDKKNILPLLQRIGQVGRAAKVHIIAATQCPIAAILSTQLKVNFDSIIGLHTRSKQDSRNITGFAGCENLPRYGQGYYIKPEGIDLYNIPMVAEEEQNRITNHWRKQSRKSLFH